MTSTVSLTESHLLGNAVLAEVATFEITARRNNQSDLESSRENSVEFESNYQLTIGVSEDKSKVQIRLTLALTSDIGAITCEVGARFDLPGATVLEPEDELLLEFANVTGVGVLFPYIGQHVSDMGIRVLGLPVLLPLPSRGYLHFSESLKE